MALFPAYTSIDEDSTGTTVCLEESYVDSDGSVEERLLLSDSEDVPTSVATSVTAPVKDFADEIYYIDRKLDFGNVRVSTLYYPGRPEYKVKSSAVCGPRTKRVKLRRYFQGAKQENGQQDEERVEVTARMTNYLRLLQTTPHDEDLWLQYIDFQEEFSGGEAALLAAEQAEERCHGEAVAKRRLWLASCHLPAERYLELLRNASASRGGTAWLTLLAGLARSVHGSGPGVRAVAAAALRDRRPPKYSALLYVYGAYLRSGGLWEQLVLLLELVISMNFPPPPRPAPTISPEQNTKLEELLTEYEEKVLSSKLPTWCVWGRVERARAVAHWRPLPPDLESADPQRTPLAADVADLLLPIVQQQELFAIAVNILRLAKIPLLPGTGWVLEALYGANFDTLEWTESDGSALLPLLEASLRTTGGCPKHTAALLVSCIDPPHYYHDQNGYLSWTEWLWESCCSWFEGAAREALVCWRMRWHSVLLAAASDSAGEEEVRVRREVRRAARRAGVLAGADTARVLGSEYAVRALQAAPPATPHCQLLYMARILYETKCSEEVRISAMTQAVLRQSPFTIQTDAPISLEVVSKAYNKCCERCKEVEDAMQEETEREEAVSLEEALLPGEGEWGRARALLGSLLQLSDWVDTLRYQPLPRNWSVRRRRFDEECCEGAVFAAHALHSGRAPHYARLLLPRHPHNALLAHMSARAPLWSGVRDPRAVETGTAALAVLLPGLLQAAGGDWSTGVLRALRRATAGWAKSHALLWSLRLLAEQRAPDGRPQSALYQALQAHPQHKWLYVQGTGSGSAEGGELADMLLEKELRLHTLYMELEQATEHCST